MPARKLMLLLLALLFAVPLSTSLAATAAQQIEDFEALSAAALPITAGETVSGELTEGTPLQLYIFSAAANDVVSIDLSSPGDAVDTYLQLLDADGNAIAFNDDGGEGRNSLLTSFVIPTDGEYYAVANSFGFAVQGEPRFGAYELTLTLDAPSDEATTVTETPETTPEATPEATAEQPTDDFAALSAGALPITAGETVSGELAEGTPLQLYVFSASADAVVSIDLSSPDDAVDTYLQLLDADGNEIAFDDDGGEGRNSLITSFVIPADGAYYAVANSYGFAVAGEPRFGAYELTLTLETPESAAEATEDAPPAATAEPQSADPVQLPDAIAIAYGDSVQAELTGTPQPYTFTAENSDLVTITLTSSDFVPRLTLRDADGTALFTQNSSEDAPDTAVVGDFFLSAAGEYRVDVAAAEGESVGAYELSLVVTTVELPTVDEQGFVTVMVEPGTDAQAITYGTIAEGALTEDAPTQAFTFNAGAGDTVSIALTGDFDTFLSLNDANGLEVDSNDDGGEETDSLIELTLEDAGVYTIIVDSYLNLREDTPTAGNYTLTFSGQPAPVIQFVAPEPQPIALGDTVSSEVTLATPLALYSLQATAGQTVTIDLTGDFDTYLFIRDEQGVEFASDDDSGEGQNSRIEAFTFPEDGNYLIVVDSYDNAIEEEPVAGSYTLVIVDADAEPADTLVEGDLPVIAYGEVIEGELTDDAPSQQYAFTALAGDVVTVRMEGDFDTFVFLLDATGAELANNDDSTETNISIIENFVIPADGTYIVQADSYGNVRLFDPRTGMFTVSVTVEGGDAVVTEPETDPETTPDEDVTGPDLDSATTGAPVAIAYGESITGELSETVANQQYTFTATEGDVITVDLTADFDTFLFLLDGNGNELLNDDDGGEGRNSRITDFPIPADGEYIILVDSYGNARLGTPYLGEYTVTLTADGDAVVVEPEETEAPPETTETPPTATDDILAIEYGQTVTGELSVDVPSQSYVFSAAEGDQVEINLASDDFDTFLTLLGPDGDLLLTDDDGGEARNSRIVFDSAAAGDYTIVADSYGNAQLGEVRNGVYTLTLDLTDAVVDQPPTEQPATPTPPPVATEPAPDVTAEPPSGDIVDINIGETVESSLTVDVPSQLYRFEAQAGDTVTITLISEDFDAFLFLRDENGAELSTDDDGGGARNARIDTYEFAESGTYIIEATSYDSARLSQAVGGAFTLSLEADAPIVTDDVPVTPIVYGDTVEDVVTFDEPFRRYSFQANSGDVVTIDLASPDFDTFLRLLDANGEELLTDDDGGQDLGSRIQGYEIPAAGEYIIEATSFGYSQLDDAREGAFTLTLSSGDAVVVDPPATEEPMTPTPTPMPDEDTLTIVVGESISGELTEDMPEIRYALEAQAGDVLDIAISSEFDTYLVVLDAADFVIAEDDDSGDGLNGALFGFEAAETATYTVVVTSFGYATGSVPRYGEFALTVTESDDAPVVQPPTDSDLAYGDTIEGELSEDQPEAEITFFGEAGDVVTIALSAFDFDTYLLLFDEAGNEVAFDDDSGGDLNSLIGPVVLPATGEYIIVASSFSWITSSTPAVGTFTLSLSETEIQVIEYGQTVEGFIEPAQSSYVYSFTGAADDLIFVDLETTDFDVFITLDSPDGLLLDQTFGSFVDLGPVTLPQTGDYILTVTSFDPSFEATFSATLRRVETEPVTIGVPVVGDFADGGPRIYTFDAESAQVITVTVDSRETVDTVLSLRGPDGVIFAEDDDGGEGRDPELFQIVIPETGTYTLTVQPFIAGTDGNFVLEVVDVPLPSLIGGPQTVQLSLKQTQSIVTFEGEAGQSVLLSAEVVGGAPGEPFIIVNQDGREIASNPIGNVERVVIEFTVPADGTVEVILQDFSGISPLALEMDIVQLAEEDEG